MYYEDMKDKETPIRRKRGRPKKTKVEEELANEAVENDEVYKEIREDFEHIDQEWMEEKVEEKVEKKVIEKVADNREKIHKYHGTWIGPPGYLQLPGVGRIFPGREIELSKKLAQALGKSPNWRIRTSYEYK